jgi:hypothetical protein
MQPSRQFTGLTMPVFTAFGWAGEENAINFALGQLEQFIHTLQARLPREIHAVLNVAGLDHAAQSVYLATSEEVESDIYIAFHARPTSLEMVMALTDQKALARALKLAESNPDLWHRLVTELGPEWSLRVQQMQVDEDSETTTHYQDLFKDSVEQLKPDTAAELVTKAAFLNGEPTWVTPIYVSRRFDAEKVALMGAAVVQIVSEQIELMTPLFRFMAGQARRQAVAKGRSKSRAAAREKAAEIPAEPEVEPLEKFTYVAELKPLHLQRGFVNLTSHHWPFFALNARTETRRVTVYYDGRYDRKSAVWRLVPDDQARLVLSPAVHDWLEDNFVADDKISITAKKLDEQEIQIDLDHADE